MEFVLTTAIRKLLKLKKRKRVIQGGTSAGKTYGILPILVDRCIKERGLEVSVVSSSIPHLRRGAIRDFFKIMIALKRFSPDRWNGTTLTYQFPNGSYIEFFSVEQDDKVRGARRNILYINECNNVNFETYNQLAIRTDMEIWLDYNPTAPFWVHRELIDKEDVDFIILTYKDNEALSESIIKDIESAKERGKTSEYWKNWFTVYGEGNLGTLDGACLSEWKEMESIPKDAKLLCAGLDFGYSNDPSVLMALYSYDGAYIFDEVFYRKGLLNSDIADLIKESGLDCIIYADASEPKSIAELNTYGLNVLKADKGRDSIMQGLGLINQNTVYITNRSTNTKRDLASYVYARDREGNRLNKPVGAFDHSADAMRYAFSMQLNNKYSGQYFI